MNEERTGKCLRQVEHIRGHLAIVSCVHFFNGNHFLVRAQRGIQYHPSKMGMSQLNKLSF
jgi:hypothetical protein